jgi:hypothetical protein
MAEEMNTRKEWLDWGLDEVCPHCMRAGWVTESHSPGAVEEIDTERHCEACGRTWWLDATPTPPEPT